MNGIHAQPVLSGLCNRYAPRHGLDWLQFERCGFPAAKPYGLRFFTRSREVREKKVWNSIPLRVFSPSRERGIRHPLAMPRSKRHWAPTWP